MPVWSWFFIAAAIVVVVALVLMAVFSAIGRRRTERLKKRFGPEYERAVDEAGGRRAGEKELVARERKHKGLDIVTLSPEAHARYAEHWRAVQTAFVDDPARAVGDADRLVTQVMRDRGYPIDDFEQRASDISVDHPKMVEHYRAAHALHAAQEHGDIGTEAQREAFVHYRALFDKLLETETVPAEASPNDPGLSVSNQRFQRRAVDS
jgi:hypothetical protein